MILVGWGYPYHRGARCEWYLSPVVLGHPDPPAPWVPVYVGDPTDDGAYAT